MRIDLSSSRPIWHLILEGVHIQSYLKLWSHAWYPPSTLIETIDLKIDMVCQIMTSQYFPNHFFFGCISSKFSCFLKKWDFRSEWPKVRNSCILHPLLFLGFSPNHRIKPSSYYSRSNHTAEHRLHVTESWCNYSLFFFLRMNVIILLKDVKAIVPCNEPRKNSSQIC